MRPLKILVIAHNASVGASSVLLDVCHYLAIHKKYEFKFIFLTGGMLRNKFDAIGQAFVVSNPFGQITGFCSLVSYLKNVFLLKWLKTTWQPALIYANTATASHFFAYFKKEELPIVMHVHELEYDMKVSRVRMENFSKIPARFITVSKVVFEHLCKLGINPQKIRLAYAAIDTGRIDESLKEIADQKNLRENVQFVIGAAGEGHWRKGIDLWLHVAARIKKKLPNVKIRFVWVGTIYEDLNQPLNLTMLHLEKKRLGLSDDEVVFTGLKDNPYPLYNQFDIFTLPSREDPCPLVVLENLYLKKPVVCFSGCGGAPELVEQDAGVVVPPLDVAAMAEAVVDLLTNPAKKITMGETGSSKVQKTFLINHLADKVSQCFQTLTAKKFS